MVFGKGPIAKLLGLTRSGAGIAVACATSMRTLLVFTILACTVPVAAQTHADRTPDISLTIPTSRCFSSRHQSGNGAQCSRSHLLPPINPTNSGHLPRYVGLSLSSIVFLNRQPLEPQGYIFRPRGYIFRPGGSIFVPRLQTLGLNSVRVRRQHRTSRSKTPHRRRPRLDSPLAHSARSRIADELFFVVSLDALRTASTPISSSSCLPVWMGSAGLAGQLDY
jgi:hypothetical protein